MTHFVTKIRPRFLLNGLAFVVAVGWGRAGYAPEIGIPLRDVSIARPALIAAYLTWTTSSSRMAVWVPRALALATVLLLPANTVAGHRHFADRYRDGMTSLRADLGRSNAPDGEIHPLI